MTSEQRTELETEFESIRSIPHGCIKMSGMKRMEEIWVALNPQKAAENDARWLKSMQSMMKS